MVLGQSADHQRAKKKPHVSTWLTQQCQAGFCCILCKHERALVWKMAYTPFQNSHLHAEVAWYCDAPCSELFLAMIAEQGIEDSGMKLAVLTCLARMLEIKSAELEGEDGTGSLERDQKILEAAKSLEGQPSPIVQEAACMLCNAGHTLAR